MEYEDEKEIIRHREFSWNDDNRMISVEKADNPQPVAEYTYDAMGRRIMKHDVVNDVYTMYYYDGLTVIAEKEKVGIGNWNWEKIYTVGPGVIGNMIRVSEYIDCLGWEDTYYHYDAIGNVVLTTDSNGSIDEAMDQEAYGKVMTGTQDGYHLTTKEYDSHPELYYFWQRWYDPKFGKFVSRAPYEIMIEYPYNYAKNNPNFYFDSTGELGICFEYEYDLELSDCQRAKGETQIKCIGVCKGASMFSTSSSGGISCPDPEKCASLSCKKKSFSFTLPIKFTYTKDIFLIGTIECTCACKAKISGSIKLCTYNEKECCP